MVFVESGLKTGLIIETQLHCRLHFDTETSGLNSELMFLISSGLYSGTTVLCKLLYQ